MRQQQPKVYSRLSAGEPFKRITTPKHIPAGGWKLWCTRQQLRPGQQVLMVVDENAYLYEASVPVQVSRV